MFFFRKRKPFKKIIKRWLLFKKFSIKSSTYYRYNYIIDKYIMKYFSRKDIHFFEDYDFNVFIEYLSEELAPKTVTDIIAVLKSILRYVERKYQLNFNF